MIKQPGTKQNTALVTFELPAEVGAARASVCGDFNAWSPDANPLAPREDGRFETTIELEAGRVFRFRYLIDGHLWENDWAADGYVPNDFGDDDSIVDLTALEDETPSRRTTKRAVTNGGTKTAPEAKAAAATKPTDKTSARSAATKSTKSAATKTTKSASTKSTGKLAATKTTKSASTKKTTKGTGKS
jgi:hypothetical protein